MFALVLLVCWFVSLLLRLRLFACFCLKNGWQCFFVCVLCVLSVVGRDSYIVLVGCVACSCVGVCSLCRCRCFGYFCGVCPVLCLLCVGLFLCA